MWKPVHIYIPYFLFWTDEQFILELSSELLLPYGVACTLVRSRRGVTYDLWWINFRILLSLWFLEINNVHCSLFVVYWWRFLLKLEPLMVSALVVFNSSWRCGQEDEHQDGCCDPDSCSADRGMAAVTMWGAHRDIRGDYRVIWEIADQITRATHDMTVNCFLVTCQQSDNINTTQEEGELMQHLADYSEHNNISELTRKAGIQLWSVRKDIYLVVCICI